MSRRLAHQQSPRDVIATVLVLQLYVRVAELSEGAKGTFRRALDSV